MGTIFTPKSKTHLFAAALAIAAGFIEWLPTVESFIPTGWYNYIIMGVSIVIIILRNVTTEAIDDK